MCISVFVSEDQAGGRARDHIDPDLAEQNALGFSDKLIARADKDICLWQVEQTISHRRNALHTPHSKDFIRAADMRGIDNRGCDPDIGTWR